MPSSDREQIARAHKALKVFRTMQPGLTAYARALTGKPTVRIQATSTAPHTDGTTIFYRPPLSLADDVKHDVSACDRRDADTLLQLCEACALREDILAAMYHEIAHIAYHSFAPFDDDDRKRAIASGVSLKGDEFSARMVKRLDQFKAKGGGTSFILLANVISEYLAGLTNILEDVRIDERMFEARKGVRRMREARARRAFREGMEQPDGTVVYWMDAPLNAQLIVGMYAAASEWSIDGHFADEVVDALLDPEMHQLAISAKTARSASDVFNIAFAALVRGKQLGFFLEEDDVQSEPEPQPEPEPDEEPDNQDLAEESSDQDQGDTDDEADDDQGAGQGEGDGEDASPAGSPDDQDSPDAAPGDASDSSADEAPDSEGDPSGDPEAAGSGADEADEQLGSDDEPSSPGSDDSDAVPDEAGDAGDSSEVPDAGGADDGGPSQDSGGTGEDLRGDEPPTEQGDVDDGQTQEDSSSEEPAAPVDPEGSEDEPGGSGAGDEGGSEGGGQEDSPGTGTGSEQSEGTQDLDDQASSGSGNDPQEQQDADLDGDRTEPNGDRSDDDSDGDGPTGEAPSDERSEAGEETSVEEDRPEPDHEESDAGDSAVPEPGFEDTENVEDGAPEDSELGDPAEPLEGQRTELNYGGADGIPELVELVTGHHGDHHAENSEGYLEDENAEEEAEALRIAIEQGVYFETAPINILGVNIHRYSDVPDSDNAWRGTNGHNIEYSTATLQSIGVYGDFDTPESILGPATQLTRRAFDDNKRAQHMKNLKSGKIRGGSLAKRAPFNDPRMFKKTVIPGKKSYAVIIGMDISGSMAYDNGHNMKLAKRAVKAQAELCSRVGVDFAIYGHTADTFDSRWETLSMEMYEIKSFDDPWNVQAKEALQNIGPLAANVDGHTLEYYRKAVERTQATDKIILYYTDGAMPAANYAEELEVLEREIKVCKQRGVHLMGVGIRTDSPRDYGMDTVRVDEDEDLVQVIRHLEKKLTDR